MLPSLRETSRSVRPGKRPCEINPYQDSGDYEVVFAGSATQVGSVPIKDPKKSPQGPIHVQKEDLLTSTHLEDGLTDGTRST
jgi:hypothetical protein